MGGVGGGNGTNSLTWLINRFLKGPAKDMPSDTSNAVMVKDGRLEREWTAESDVTYYPP